ncbi:hypothetical protein UA08_03483 [Talaromyces atroroseus]|uniref:Fe2OG dioxygenase domain-containing protein n=1 Tax=Talaromyces atroroseus TaxID=1441469 RepID=A0A225AV98_TALAT|nr:hypothetical protein UA08_03483 [Talaromyces atroroseus]OKL61228.1 hypothetical protein UA08_03483 [Talaromyces atroroseus]
MASEGYTHVELLTLSGPEYRRVSKAPPRIPTADEIPIINLTAIDGDLNSRKQLAAEVRAASQNTGFFYIRNHGIPESLIKDALSQAQAFFAQPEAEKEKASIRKSSSFNGYYGVGSTQVNRTESKDHKETFSFGYNPRNDKTVEDVESLIASNPDAYKDDDHDAMWEGVKHLPGFQKTLIEFWQCRLALARKLIRIFALALCLPEDYFDKMITHPGADSNMIHYPGTAGCEEGGIDKEIDVGIGSHTDIQCITLLWQDAPGLQVLSSNDEWLDARPIPGTLVVNIGDFLQRLSNNTFKSTVHRVYNKQVTSRYSMPFFLGFNPEAVCEVVPSCISEESPALYAPISCGQWHHDRRALARARKAAA